MGNINSFPLVLSIKSGDGVQSELNRFDAIVRAAANGASASMQEAGRAADKSFRFEGVRREVKALASELDSFRGRMAAKQADPFGIQASLKNLASDPFGRIANEMIAIENRLAAQRAKAHAEHMANIAAEAQAGISAVQQRQAAQTAAFKAAEAEGNRVLALERQRIAEASQMVAGPQLMQGVNINPRGAQQAATAARAYANAQREIAEAATATARAVGTATAADKAFATTARQAAAAAEVEAQRLETVAATHTKVAGALVAAGGSLARTSAAAATSAGAQRAAYANLSNQIADVAIQAQMGTSAFTILLQQGSQASFALAQTGGRLAALGRFLTNPWVAAATTAALVLGTVVTKMHEAGDASHLAKVGANALTDAQGVLGNMFDLTSGKLEKQNELLRLNARLTAINLRADAAAKRSSSQETFGNGGLSALTRARAGASAWLPGIVGNLVGGDYFKARENQQALRRLEQERQAAEKIPNDRAHADARAKAIDAVMRKSERLDFSGLKITGDEYRQALVDRATSGINEQVATLIDESLNSGTLAKDLRNKPTKTKTGGSGAANRIAGMEESGRDILDRINSIAAPFGDQPKLIQQTAKAMADLADITDDLNRKNAAYVKATGKTLPGYAEAKQAAKDAAAAIDNAPVMAIQKQTDALADQVRVQELMAQGRPQEAEALQAKLQIIRAIGVELEKEPEAVQKALAQYEEQRKRLAQLTVDANAANATRQLSEENQILAAQLAGNERLAEIMGRRFQLEQGMAKLSDPAVQALQHQVDLNRQLTQERERQNQLISIQVEQARQLQSAFENFLTDPFKKGSLKELADTFTGARKQAFAREISVKLFGDMGASVEDRLRNGGDAVKAAGEALNGSADALTGFASNATSAFGTVATNLNKSAEAISQAAAGLASANDNAPTLGQMNITPTAFGGASGDTPAEVLPDGTIVVTAKRTPQQQAGSLTGLYDFAKDLQGIDVNFGNVSRVMSGGGYGTSLNGITGLLSFASSAVGGKAGAAINGMLNAAAMMQMGSMAGSSIAQLGGSAGLATGIGSAIGGMGAGMAADGILKALGMKGSSTGSAIGGAIGGAAFGPIGGFIGGALGSIVGGMLKKTAYSTSTFGMSNGLLIKGNNSGNKASASTAAKGSRDAVVEGFNEILEQFGGTLKGDPGVSIGVYDGKYRVSTTGYKGKLDFKGSSANGLVNFGKDGAEEAVKFAIQTMFEKGVIDGIRASTKKLISAGTDLQKQLDKAVAFESVFTELKSYTDPVGAAIDEVDKRFKALRKIFEEASASTEEYSKLEQLYAYKRAEAVEQASKDMTSSLQGFLDSLRFSGETGLSLGTRQKNAKAAFDPIAANIMAGKPIDQDKFTETAQSYLDIARQIYGSTQGYFDLLNNVTDLTVKAVANAGGNVTPITAAAGTTASAAAAAGADITGATAAGVAANQAQSYTAASSTVVTAINDQTSRLESKLDQKFDALTAAFDRFSTPRPAAASSGLAMAATRLAALRNA